MKRLLVVLAAVVALAGCSSSGSKPSGPYNGDSPDLGCNMQCLTNLNEAMTGKPLPSGSAFNYDTSRCALWNGYPTVVRMYLTGLIATKLGAVKPGCTVQLVCACS